MLWSFYPGETVRVSARDLIHTESGEVTTGATVTMTVLNPDGSTYQESPATTGGSGNDWFADIPAPDTPGVYGIRVVAVVAGATWKGAGAFTVRSF